MTRYPRQPLAAIASFFETRRRHIRDAAERSRLQRELSRLPNYVARDIGAATNQDRFITGIDI